MLGTNSNDCKFLEKKFDKISVAKSLASFCSLNNFCVGCSTIMGMLKKKYVHMAANYCYFIPRKPITVSEGNMMINLKDKLRVEPNTSIPERLVPYPFLHTAPPPPPFNASFIYTRKENILDIILAWWVIMLAI